MKTFLIAAASTLIALPALAQDIATGEALVKEPFAGETVAATPRLEPRIPGATATDTASTGLIDDTTSWSRPLLPDADPGTPAK